MKQNGIVQDSAYKVPVHNQTGSTLGPKAFSDLMRFRTECTIACDAYSDRKHYRMVCTSRYTRSLTRMAIASDRRCLSCFLFAGMSGSFAVREAALCTHLLGCNSPGDRHVLRNYININLLQSSKNPTF